MIRFNEDEVCQMIRALTHYRNNVAGDDTIWDRYDHLVDKMTKYGEEVSPTKLSCTNTK
jgi:hypothetical protein